MRKLTFLLTCISFVLSLGFSQAQVTDDQIVTPNRKNAKEQKEKPYVILISVYGFRHDYFEKYKPTFLNTIAGQAVKAEYMSPSFTSVTFSYYYTILKGLIPLNN